MITEADGNAYEDSSRADSQPPSKRRCLELPTARFNVNKAGGLTVGWIVTANLPFTALSNPYLRRMLDLHDASLAKEVPWSRQSVRDTYHAEIIRGEEGSNIVSIGEGSHKD
jgi:hypothetical protein